MPTVSPSLPPPSELTPPSYIVGIGASAGGLEAFSTFFSQMPPDSGMAFVLIQHLDPHQPSLLPELLARQTAMPVHAVTEQLRIMPNHVYIIASNTALTIEHGILYPAVPAEAHGHRKLIDHFLQSLALDRGTHAIGILLSGADTDGTLGLAAIQDAGGMTIAQLPALARFATMPQSAIDRRVVDHILPVTEMPALLRTYSDSPTPPLPPGPVAPPTNLHSELQTICAILAHSTSHDFSLYKPANLLRRINRRMQLRHTTDLHAYAEQLRTSELEVAALFQDLLISVTSFFRDAEVFETLATTVIPTLFRDKHPNAPLRVWVIGCATGEEAYTIAILLREQLDRMDTPPPVQLFATDLDEAALTVARHGRYAADSVAHIAPERLTRFFTVVDTGYQVSPVLRDMCLFSPHNLISDPPFAHIQLIVCRNLLIYFTPQLQQQIIPLLHYALVPNGYLLLGTSEHSATNHELFRTVDARHQIYQRNEVQIRSHLAFPLSSSLHQPIRLPRPPLPPPQDVGTLLERLLHAHYTPPAVVIDAQGTIIYFSGHTGTYLTAPSGAPSLDIYAMVHQDIRAALHTAIYTATKQQTTITHEGLRITTPLGQQQLTLIVRPFPELTSDSGLLLVIFQAVDAIKPFDSTGAPDDAATVGSIPLHQLANELESTRATLETTILELQIANADLTAANEELLSMNEELQSANEELQVSKEEIQSINEEIQTINAELRRKIEELDRANADLANLFASTQIPALFLHADGRIARFTPTATKVFCLIDADRGRPITDIAPRFAVGDFMTIITTVLQTLDPYEQPVYQPESDTWWLLRIRPYLTLNNVIDGVVATFTDITNLKRAEVIREQLLQEVLTAQAYAERIVETVSEPLLILDTDMRIQSANPAFYQRFTLTSAETQYALLFELSNGAWNQPIFCTQFAAIRDQQITMFDLELTQTFPHLGLRTMRLQARPIEHLPSGAQLILLAITDITDLIHAATTLQEAHDVLEQRVEERTRELETLNAALQVEATEHRRSEQVRQHLLQQLVTAQEEERRRVARELHDQMGQDLTGLILGLKTLQDAVADTPAAQRVLQLQSLAMQIGEEVRVLAVQLRPTVLDDLGLAVTLKNYVGQWSDRALVAVDLHMAGIEEATLPLAVESTIYRLVQEALNNILKHAHATSVSLIIERRTDEVRMIIEDDGVGFDTVVVRSHALAAQQLGLLGMDERVAQLGGTLTIESTPGSGTSLFIRIPLSPAA